MYMYFPVAIFFCFHGIFLVHHNFLFTIIFGSSPKLLFWFHISVNRPFRFTCIYGSILFSVLQNFRFTILFFGSHAFFVHHYFCSTDIFLILLVMFTGIFWFTFVLFISFIFYWTLWLRVVGIKEVQRWFSCARLCTLIFSEPSFCKLMIQKTYIKRFILNQATITYAPRNKKCIRKQM